MLQGSICVGSASWDKKRADMKGIRKLTPTQPPLSPRSRFRAPANVIAAASGTHSNPEQQAVKLRLQQAFVEQYSGTEQKVCYLVALRLYCKSSVHPPTMIKASTCSCLL